MSTQIILSTTVNSVAITGNAITISAATSAITGIGIPTGGTTGQSLIKNSSTNYDVIWGNPTASAAWGSITGTLNNQTDLQSALNAKQNTLTLTTTGSSGAATLSGSALNIPQYSGGMYTAGTGLTLTGGAFSVNASQNITNLTNLNTAALVKTTGTGGTLAAAVAGTDYLAPFGSETANYFYAAPNGTAGTPLFRAMIAADVPTLNQNTTGQAGTAVALATARTINGVNFDGSANITVAAAAGTLTGTALASGVVSSSLTSVGTVMSGTWSGAFGAVSGANLTGLTAANIAAGTAGISVTGNAGTVTTINGLVTAGSNVTVSGVGTSASPYSIASTAGGTGTVTSVSVVSTNGFAGTVANSTTTPAITLTTSITGIIKSNGTAISAAISNTDYLPVASPTATGAFTIASNSQSLIVGDGTNTTAFMGFATRGYVGYNSVRGTTTIQAISGRGIDFNVNNNTFGLGQSVTISSGGVVNISELTASSAVVTDSSSNLVSVANTGSGNNVLANSPTLVTPALGTPASGVATNLTGTASGLTAGMVTTISGLITQGTNVTITGSGTSGSPYTIAASTSGSIPQANFTLVG